MSQYDEASSLNNDLLEIYADWGTQELSLLKLISPQCDDVYGEPTLEYEEYKCIGRYRPTPIEELQTGVGLGVEEAFYTIYVVTSILHEQGVHSVTVKDKIKYKDVEMDILSVVPSAIIGDYALQWKIQAKGKNLPSLTLNPELPPVEEPNPGEEEIQE